MEHILQATSWAKNSEAFSVVKNLSNRVKQMALQLTEIEVKLFSQELATALDQVEDATNHEPWGPHGTVMAEITKAAYEQESYRQIMGVIARRLQSQGEEWRHVYKALLLLEYLSKHGPQKVVQELLSNIGVVERLTSFQYKDANGKDWGLNVRQRAKELAALVQDPDRIRAERQKAKANENKYTGVSSSEVTAFGATTSSSSSRSSAIGSALGSALGGSRGSGKYSKSLGGGLGGMGNFEGGSSGEAGYHDYDEAPKSASDKLAAKEETRKRIEALRKEGLVESEGVTDLGTLPTATGVKISTTGAPAKAPALRGRAAAEAQSERGPKKLSDVRVNPNIAASLGVLPTPPSSNSGAPSAAPGGRPPVNAIDLLGGLDDPTPAPSRGGCAAGGWDAFSAASPAAPEADSWGAFGASTSAPAPSTAAVDPFATFQAAASPQASADPFGLSPAPATSAKPLRGALAEDLFAAPFSAPAPAPQGDLFGDFSGVSSSPAALNGLAHPPSPTSATPAYVGALGGPALKPSYNATPTAPPPKGMVAPPAAAPLTPRSSKLDPFAGLAGF